jgi:hypothetical protein
MEGNMSAFNRPNLPTEPRRPWVAPTLKLVGTIADVLQGGGGKLSLTGGDPGDHRKQAPAM